MILYSKKVDWEHQKFTIHRQFQWMRLNSFNQFTRFEKICDIYIKQYEIYLQLFDQLKLLYLYCYLCCYNYY
jgi:hypothetical protein